MKRIAIGTILAVGIGATALFAQEPGSTRSDAPGWGMMGGCYGGGAEGRGPGHRGGFGMMDGRGMGPGMMGGMGGPMGLPNARALAALDLTDAQRKQLVAIEDETRKKNWTSMGAMHDEMAKVRDAFWVGEKRDRAAILAGNKRMFDIRQQMLETSLDAADRIEQVLTPQQRAQLKKHAGPGWMLDSDE
jgi:Spy/CpxP family protein refolding chaperone